jgi:FkbM family methyltransferase
MLKLQAKKLVEHLGLSVRRRSRVGGDPFLDMRRLIGAKNVTVFDVGSNEGQSIDLFRMHFKNVAIHAFEPGKQAFSILESRHASTAGIIKLNNFGLGSRDESRQFVETVPSSMSSFLEPGREAWGSVASRQALDIHTLDAYSAANRVNFIDILKIDTQGFDLEVLKGADRMMREHRIRLIFVELIFSDMYEGMPRFDEILRFILDRNFVLVSMYEVFHLNERAAWSDALFIDPMYRA